VARGWGEEAPLTEKRKEIGMLGEAMAVRFLKKRGYRILQQNFRCRMGEIDVVAQEEGNTVFVEVRTSTSSDHNAPAESILWKKKKKLVALANFYIKRFGLEEMPCRFDVIAITQNNGYTRIRLIRDAFWEV